MIMAFLAGFLAGVFVAVMIYERCIHQINLNTLGKLETLRSKFKERPY